MGADGGGLELTAVELSGVRLRVVYTAGKDQAVHLPKLVRLGREVLYLEWPSVPAGLRKFRLEWSDNPFSPVPFQGQCSVLEKQAEGLLAGFDGSPPAGLADWLERAAESLRREPEEEALPNAAVQTSQLYTRATVVSATGLLCGALAILLPLLIGDRGWVDLLSKVLLVLMVASIAGFAWLRALAGRAEIRALGQGRG